MGPTDAATMEAAVKGSRIYAKYATVADSESAAEEIAAEPQAASATARAQAAQKAAQKTAKKPPRSRQEAVKKSAKASAKASPAKHDDSMLEEVVKSSAFKNATNTAAREIVKGLFRRR